MLKLIALAENTAGRRCFAEHGLSFYIEGKSKYLFDTGSSNLFLENSARIGLDLSAVQTLVLSHGHDDHSGGLKYLRNKKLIGHPDVFMKRFRKSNGTSLGLPVSKKELLNLGFELQLSEKPIQLDEDAWFLGGIPKVTDFEAQTTAFVDEQGNEDFIPDDSGMVFKTPKGLVVISGCAHSGVCNTILHARDITNEKKVYAVVGGFHLTAANEQTQKTIGFLKDLKVEKVVPSHCTAFPALAVFYKHFPFMQLKTGNILEF